MGRTIFALFDDLTVAQRVASTLEREGYDGNGISVLAPRAVGDYGLSSRLSETAGQPDRGVTASPRGFQDIAIPGLGRAVANGPLTAAMAECDAGTGGLVGLLERLGFEVPAARHYYESLRRRLVLLALESPDSRVGKAVEVMRKNGARAVEDIPVTNGAPDRSTNGAPDRATFAEPASAQETLLDQVTVPVVEEQLEVGKRQISRGGVRVNSQIVEHPIHENIRLREERVSVERRPVDREATEADLAAFKEGSIEIHETVEEPVISKRRRVVEEVVIGRELRERTQEITETVRKTQVNVEPLAPANPGSPNVAERAELRHAEEADVPASEEQYEPAYRYGLNLARDERYRHANWNEVEPHARRGWEEENGGTWEQFKDAVRTAWHRVSNR